MKRLPLLLMVMMAATASAQMPDAAWYFGRRAGIDFTATPPKLLNDGAIETLEGSASVCDPVTGTILFYTNGVTVWNRHHRPMPNGKGLLGGISSTQSALIVPAPGSPSLYYLFTTGQAEGETNLTDGICYSVVDITADGGNGDVVRKNVRLMPNATEMLAGAAHCNGRDIWILGHRWKSNDHVAFLVDPSGVSPNPVVSSVGPQVGLNGAASGAIRASGDGRHIAMTAWDLDSTSTSATLYDFDPSSGVVSRPIDLDERGGAYWSCFSPDNSKLYVGAFSQGIIRQYDLSRYDADAIRRSKTEIVGEYGYGMLGQFQLGPDGRIYVTRSKQQYLGVIERPNLAGSACGYVPNGFYLGEECEIGMPNHIDARGRDVEMTGGMQRHTLCIGSSRTLAASPGVSYRWTPSDGLSCADCREPVVTTLSSTRYLVTVTSPSGCEIVDTFDLTVVPLPTADAGEDITLCVGESAPLSARGGTTYRWSPADGLSCADCPDPVATPTASRRYVVTTSTGGECTASDTVEITVNSYALRLHIPKDITGEPGDTVMVAIVLDEVAQTPPIDGITLQLGYDHDMMRPVIAGGEGEWLKGTSLQGWSITAAATTPGMLTMRLAAPPSEWLRGPQGTLLRIPFATYITQSELAFKTLSCDLALTADIGREACIATDGGAVQLQLCGSGTRLIERTAFKYAITGAAVNPVAGDGAISFSLGLDGPTTLTLYDADGGRVATLLDGHLDAGNHTARFDGARLPSGLYLYRLVSGTWSVSGSLVVAR